MDRGLVQPASSPFRVGISLAGQLRACSCDGPGGVRRSGEMHQPAIFGDTKPKGQASEIAAPGALYADDFLRRQSKNPLGASVRAARGQTAPGKIDAKNEDDEDEKLSTKPGQLHLA